MTTLLNFLREARSRLGRAWDLLVTGGDDAMVQLQEFWMRQVATLDEALLRTKRENEELRSTIATIRAAVSNAP